MEYTNHALERMGERSISRSTVLAVVKNGEKIEAEGGRTAYTCFGYIVVTCPESKTVITVYNADEFSPSWSKKKAKVKRAQQFRKQLRENKKHSGECW